MSGWLCVPDGKEGEPCSLTSCLATVLSQCKNGGASILNMESLSMAPIMFFLLVVGHFSHEL